MLPSKKNQNSGLIQDVDEKSFSIKVLFLPKVNKNKCKIGKKYHF
jgi:hypothetical protein